MSQPEHNIDSKIVIRLGSDQPAQVILITQELLSLDTTRVTKVLGVSQNAGF